MDIRGLNPFMNAIDAPDGFRRPLMWCNRAIKRALEYLLTLHGTRFDYQTIFELIGEPVGLRAFLYGASGMTLDEFDAVFREIFVGEKVESDQEKSYQRRINEGLSAYLPPSSVAPLPPEADEYPDIAAHEKIEKSDPINWVEWYVALRKIGFTLTEIDDMTLRAMIAVIKQASGVKDEDPAAIFFS